MPANPQPLRLRKKHAPTDAANVRAEDGARLVEAQSLRSAIVASLIAIILFSFLWVLITRVTGRAFPWMTILLGILTGYAVRGAGRGVDWHFPVLAAVMTLVGALVANIVVAASYTAETMGTSTLEVLRAVTVMTWPVYFGEVVTAADYIYAAFAAALAAFFSYRKLSRSEYRALRLYRHH